MLKEIHFMLAMKNSFLLTEHWTVLMLAVILEVMKMTAALAVQRKNVYVICLMMH